MTPMVFAMPGNEALADQICQARAWEAGRWQTRRFPDGETYVRYLCDIKGREVAIICSLADPDAKATALYLAACVARELGASRVGLVVPYLAYMRQDIPFHPGEGITARHFARLLSSACDWLVTVDPHLHRIHHLDQVYSVPTRVVHASPRIATWIAANVPLPLLVGPDAESEQWVSEVAAVVGCPYTLLQKTRNGDRDVEVSVPVIDAWRERTPVLIDDIASTARTMIAAVARLRQAGLALPWCIAVHALFVDDAYAQLMAAGVAGIVSTNTVSHPSNQIDVSGAIGDAIKALSRPVPCVPRA
jgi:ribose-phosphate pyrophosphokinase